MQALNELNEGGGGLPHALAGDVEGDGSSHGKAGRGCGEQRSVLPSLPFGFWVLACTSVVAFAYMVRHTATCMYPTDVGGRWPAAIVLRHRRRPEEASKQYPGEAPYTNRGLRHVGEAPLTNRGSATWTCM